MNAVHVLLFVAVASPLIALLSTGQDPANTDWPKEVERACTSPRYGLRLAAARKVAQGGGAAVPAIRAFATAKGINEVPQSLVASLADDAPNDAPVIELLREWASTPSFYWRSEAMRGLALRAPKVPARDLGPLFVEHYADAAWLTRVHAQLGGVLLGDPNAQKLPERDPRARVKLAALLLQNTQQQPLQPLLDALGDERTFQGDPWGQRLAGEANKALKGWLGDRYPEIAGGDTEGGARAIAAACKEKSGQDLKAAAPKKDPATPFPGGIELLSCQHGDLFVQWTAAGEVHVGLDDAKIVQLPADAWSALEAERKALELPAAMGNVVCDNLRLRWEQPAVHVKAAPASLTPAAAAWLEHLARSMEQAGEPAAAQALRAGLAQFAPR